MKKILSIMIAIILVVFSVVGCSKKTNEVVKKDVLSKTQDEIIESAKGSTVSFYGYGGDEVMNKWFDKNVIPQMKEKYDITVKRVGMDIDSILNQLITEKQVKNADGTIDVVWINGENFKNAKENDLLLGAFTKKLENFEKYVDTKLDDITVDFGTNTSEMEAPWGKSQFTILKNNKNVNESIKSADELKKIIKKYPGKFTYSALPDFTGSAFVRNIIYDVVGYENIKNLPEDEAKVKEAIKPAIDYLNEIKPYLWNKGTTYPSTLSQLDNMYSDNEVYFTMTYAPSSVSKRIESGEFNKETKTIKFDKGNLGNTHFLTIPNTSPNPDGAIVLINYLLGLEAQSSKSNINNWGDASIIDISKLNNDEKKMFDNSIVIENSVPELKAGLVPIIEKIWTEEVLESAK